MKIGPITIITTNKLEALESVVKEMAKKLKLRTKITERLLAKNTALKARLNRYEDVE
jgi:hypothetical protein